MLQFRQPHVAQQLQGLLPLLALVARADASAAADDVQLKFRRPHVAEQHQSLLPLLALLARADQSVVAVTLGSSFASRISLNSASARCHCSPFSHALMPAL
ncbi:unnamed protein product [Prorocentrum cordatum]|uniref:Secreted protein n=1 Tax=Prorocentrum cordatum TaxID=2364126 RepID=A0ABN9SDJ4_9DINO|nr:unnamed protein product [Polarella glacialis]